MTDTVQLDPVPTKTADPLVIRHPSWCLADEETPRTLEDWQYEAPAERESEHRARTYHVDAGDTTFRVACVQPFDVLPGHPVQVSQPGIALDAHEHAVVGDISCWLTVAEAELLVHQLGRALSDIRHGHHLPVEVQR